MRQNFSRLFGIFAVIGHDRTPGMMICTNSTLLILLISIPLVSLALLGLVLKEKLAAT
jgi:hypothetical protein